MLMSYADVFPDGSGGAVGVDAGGLVLLGGHDPGGSPDPAEGTLITIGSGPSFDSPLIWRLKPMDLFTLTVTSQSDFSFVHPAGNEHSSLLVSRGWPRINWVLDQVKTRRPPSSHL